MDVAEIGHGVSASGAHWVAYRTPRGTVRVSVADYFAETMIFACDAAGVVTNWNELWAGPSMAHRAALAKWLGENE
jgi:hypothetical protein